MTDAIEILKDDGDGEYEHLLWEMSVVEPDHDPIKIAPLKTVESHTMPAGFVVEYNDKNHRYKIDGEFVTSVTTILGKVVPKGGLDWWAARLVCEGMQELSRQGIEPENARDAEDLLKGHGLWFTQAKTNAADRGTAVHDAFEKLGAGEELWIANYGDQRGYVQALNKWWLEYSPEVVAQELVVGSKKESFAGRFDLLCRIDGVLWLIDLKTSKAVYESHHFQLGLYAAALKESGYEAPERLGVLRVGPDGEFEFVESPSCALDAVVCLPWFRAQKDLAKQLKEAA